MDIADWWDICAKPAIKRFCIAYSIQRKLRRDQTKEYLISYLKIVTQTKDWEEVNRVKELLSKMLQEDAMGFLVRSRFKQNAEHERASLFHAARELSNKKSNINSLKIQGAVSNNADQIEAEVTTFFKALFNGYHDNALKIKDIPFVPDNSKLNEFLQHLSVMNEQESEKLDEDLDIYELDEVIKECVANKAPGLDGICYEFYKVTWHIIRKTFLMVLQCQLDRERIVDSNRMGVTRLLSKVSGVPRVDELRPITLLNCDYRILAKLLVKRMKPVLPSVIKSSQLCTVGKKNILFGISNILSSICYANQNHRGVCLISLDFFKAYDRVLVSFLLRVMNKMGFSERFCRWIGMLHHKPQTKFILSKLTKVIDICFSIRQGDPLSMILYIIYIEPLLMYLENHVVGLSLPGSLSGQPFLSQSTEAYCDDLNLVTEDDNDFLIIDEAVKNFEAVSGAILSRNRKCKVIGFGRWKNRENWPLPYLVSVSELKIFGIIIMNNFKNLLKRNMETRFIKFQQVLISWSSRSFDTLAQRVEVVKVFALSRIYYLASVLPLSRSFISNIEKAIGKFIWSGKILRVSINDLKLVPGRGGLGLTCLDSMGKSLLLTQLLRLLRSEDHRSVGHIGYWMGQIVADLLPGVFSGVHAPQVPKIYLQLADVVAEAMVSEAIAPLTWKTVTNRSVYLVHARNFPVTKVEQDCGSNMENIWKKLVLPSLTSIVRETMFLFIHNKLPVKERLFRIQVVNDPYCTFCLDDTGAAVCDIEHMFISCVHICDIWKEIRHLVNPLLTQKNVTDFQLLCFNFKSANHGAEISWLLGNYVHEVWTKFINKGRIIRRGELFGYLKFKFKQDQLGARFKMKSIPNF